ncbi:MAG: LysE family translocator [Anaerolineales bacterium]|nr:LysE family translocator [Anaerolineales bacterium]
MPDITTFGVFLMAAFILSITPGPGMFYVLTRSIKGGRSEGIASTLGTTVGGLCHVVAAALGLSAVLATSAIAFGVIKYMGAAYLIYLGFRTLRQGDHVSTFYLSSVGKDSHAFRQGIITEALNPKTALFFLAFIPQFIKPEGLVVIQFLLLGGISVLLNSTADLVVASLAGPISHRLTENVNLRWGQRLFSGWSLIALGTYVAVADET